MQGSVYNTHRILKVISEQKKCVLYTGKYGRFLSKLCWPFFSLVYKSRCNFLVKNLFLKGRLIHEQIRYINCVAISANHYSVWKPFFLELPQMEKISKPERLKRARELKREKARGYSKNTMLNIVKRSNKIRMQDEKDKRSQTQTGSRG